MAAARAGNKLTVGSAQWITEERKTVQDIVAQDAEEFSFGARNELEWLNERMAEIFDENQFAFADTFKTPGKLRGKTPHTARKRDPLEVRAPLSNIFSSVTRPTNSPLRQPVLQRPAPAFRIAEDVPEKNSSPRDVTRAAFADSGFYGTQASQSAQNESQMTTHSESPVTTLNRSSDSMPLPAVNVADGEKRMQSSIEPAQEIMATIDTPNSSTPDAGSAVESDDETELIREVVAPQLSPTPTRIRNVPTARQKSPLKEIILQYADVTSPAPAVKNFPAEQPGYAVADSPIEESSPVRPIVRKSSLSFASLPAREPLTTKKSVGARTSRTSHMDQARTSYYGRHTGGKSLIDEQHQNTDEDDIEESDAVNSSMSRPIEETQESIMHSKTSTQRLQDQISMLGQAPAPSRRVSKPIANATAIVVPAAAPENIEFVHIESAKKLAPGAFPEDEEDSWIGPSHASASTAIDTNSGEEKDIVIPNHSTSVDESNASSWMIPKQRSPTKEMGQALNSTRAIMKSASTSVMASPNKTPDGGEPLFKKGVSVSNPEPKFSSSPQKDPKASPSRILKDSPLKAAKDKMVSVLKTSRGLFVASAAISAGAHMLTKANTAPLDAPDREQNAMPIGGPSTYPVLPVTESPATFRRQRASLERDEKRLEKEAKEARMMQDQLDKLEKARQKESEKARAYNESSIMSASSKVPADERSEHDNQHKSDMQTEPPRATRSSPRKIKAQQDADADMTCGMNSVEQDTTLQSFAASTSSRVLGVSGIAKPTKEAVRRIVKPTSHAAAQRTLKPTHIRVHTGAHAGTSRTAPNMTNNALAASLAETLSMAPSSSAATSRAHVAPNHKQSTSSSTSIKSSTTRGKPAALAAAARKKEQDELAAQRRVDAKLEREQQRQRLLEDEERKKEQQRLEDETRAKAQRQALEEAKSRRAPPPAAPPNDTAIKADQPPPSVPQRLEGRPARPESRLESRVTNAVRSQNLTAHALNKAVAKRPLEAEEPLRPAMPRSGPSYTQNGDKRRRTGEEEVLQETTQRPNLGAPIRQSSVRQKLAHADAPFRSQVTGPQDVANKSLFANGYAPVPPASQGGPNIFHQPQRPVQVAMSKPAHPMDMANNSKAPISFASNATQSTQHKTPARPGVATAAGMAGRSTGKGHAKSSPRYQNGESIELPEINTDSEDDEDSDSGGGKKDFNVPVWANSPNLVAGLLGQETIDPVSVFGRPGELKMEEVFKNKERWGKFRQRTSSANWSGNDRLTEDEVKRDLEARERLRREGGWSYGLS